MRLPAVLDRVRRRWLGTYEFDDPRPMAAGAPYTYLLPSKAELAAIQRGDQVKVIIRSIPPSSEWDAERIWVIVTEAEDDQLVGKLQNQPFDIPQLRPGDRLHFNRWHVVSVIWADEREQTPPQPAAYRDYWERCLVDDCVLRGHTPVDYLYRENPHMTQEGDEYPDSGWRIRGTADGITADEVEGHEPQYIAIGAVLNEDDSWLALIDEPVGSAFIRNLSTGYFEACERENQ